MFLKSFWDTDISNAIGFGVTGDTGIERTGIGRDPANINVSALVMFSGYLSSQLFFMVLLPLQAAHRHEPGQSMFFLKSDLERQKIRILKEFFNCSYFDVLYFLVPRFSDVFYLLLKRSNPERLLYRWAPLGVHLPRSRD